MKAHQLIGLILIMVGLTFISGLVPFQIFWREGYGWFPNAIGVQKVAIRTARLGWRGNVTFYRTYLLFNETTLKIKCKPTVTFPIHSIIVSFRKGKVDLVSLKQMEEYWEGEYKAEYGTYEAVFNIMKDKYKAGAVIGIIHLKVLTPEQYKEFKEKTLWQDDYRAMVNGVATHITEKAVDAPQPPTIENQMKAIESPRQKYAPIIGGASIVAGTILFLIKRRG